MSYLTHLTAKTTVCAICAQNGPTCCQLGQVKPDFSFPISYIEKEIISGCDGWAGMYFTVRVPNSVRFLSRLKNLFPDDLERIQALYPEHDRHEHLSTDGQRRCIFLGPKGCLLPGKARPLYCRLFPFWVIGGRVAFFPFEFCQAQKGAKSLNKVKRRLKMNTSQIFSLYQELRGAWLLDE
jgi:Fe-S-cluster containining protein